MSTRNPLPIIPEAEIDGRRTPTDFDLLLLCPQSRQAWTACPECGQAWAELNPACTLHACLFLEDETP